MPATNPALGNDDDMCEEIIRELTGCHQVDEAISEIAAFISDPVQFERMSAALCRIAYATLRPHDAVPQSDEGSKHRS
jgi:hypothetical protein